MDQRSPTALVLLPLLAMGLSFSLSRQALGADEEKWKKHRTTDLKLNNERQLVTPGLLDTDLQATVTFPIDGRPVVLDLPHAGKDARGKSRPALKGVYKSNFLWVDLNGDGRQAKGEVFPAKTGTSVGPFVYKASYDDGTEGTYIFKLVNSGKVGRFAIIRCCGKQVRIGGSQIVLLDDNGNGRYDDIGKDSLLVNREPVTFLSRQVYLDKKFHEILVHPAGQIIETRPIKDARLAKLNMFLLHKPPQKSESLKIHTLIVSGREGSFSFDRKRPERMVPIGAYDMTFGLFERGKEQVILKSGDRTSFRVEPDKVTSPQWGGPVTGSFKIESDGLEITVYPPVYKGLGSEVYRPVDWNIPLRGYKLLVWRDERLNNLERLEAQGNKRFKVPPGGAPEPLKFEHYRNDELMFRISYASGILGSVTLEDRISFIAKRR